MDAQDIRRRLADPFPPEVMGWKAQTVSKDGQRALAVGYIDARDVMDRLDDVVGIDGWEDDYKELPNGAVLCTLRVKIADSWVAKQDVGGESDQPDKGDKAKAAHSDALKRAAIKFGIGRYIYSLPKVWCPYDGQKKQLSQTPQLPGWALPGGSGRPAAQPAAPRQADRPQTKPVDPTPNPILRENFADRYKNAQSPAEVSNVDKAVAEKVRELAEVDRSFLRNERASALGRFAKQPA